MAATKRIRSAAIYARLSVTTEESVSIERQVDAARKYADARGWAVALVAVDDGVSATKTKPEERAGWRELMSSPERYDAVIVWKVDRLARRVLDFLHADEALQARGAGIVAVEDPVDMTTAQGRAFATMLAVFGEMEAAAISARVTSARRALLAAGRRAGGRPPFGWRNVPNPDGPGFVLGRDPERIGIVATMAERALGGESLYSLRKWLQASGVRPRERGKRKDAELWHEASVEAILRNPALAGMTPDRGDVLRDRDGLPIVDEELAVITPAEPRRLLAVLDERKRPGSRPYDSRSGTALLYGLIRCGSCEGLMYRATAAGISSYRCQHERCTRRVSLGREAVEKLVVAQFLDTVGRMPVVRYREEPQADPAPRLAEVEAAIADTLSSLAEDGADVSTLTSRLEGLKALRARARSEAEAAPARVAERSGETFSEAWEALGVDDVLGRRALLMSGLESVRVLPAEKRGGRGIDPARVKLVWREGGAEDYDAE